MEILNENTLVVETVNGVPLLFPISYKTDQTAYNGCGPDGLSSVVPDTILGLTIFGVCRIHDHMCERCSNLIDEIITDGVFAFNIITTIVNNTKNTLTLWARLLVAVKYIIAVSGTTFTKSYWKVNSIKFPKGRYLKG